MADRQHQTPHQTRHTRTGRTRTRHGLRAAAAALLAALLAVGLLPGTAPAQAAAGDPAPTVAVLSGAIEQLTLNTPGDVWSGGWVRVSGQDVVLPRNLLLDLPANRMSLQQLFAAAPQACKDRGESGLAAADACNLGAAGFVTVQANRTSAGDVIAGDVFVEKGREILTGKVTAVDVDHGTFTVGGNAGSAGTLVRLNDPTGRHTVQSGAGCRAGSPNCSPDPRFTLDPDNYTNAFSTGYPFCLPSTTPRTFADTLDLDGNSTTTTLVAQSDAAGNGDRLCPDGNRNVDNVALDSRRLAPLEVGDPVTVRGNVETVGGTRFLSAYSTKVGVALSTNEGADQPDYMVLDEMFIDAPAFQRQRIRDQFIGATTEADSDVVLYSVQRDPVDNSAHEFQLGTVVGCENVAGPLTCRRVLGPNTFRIRHDTLTLTNAAKNPKLDACLQLRSDPRLGFGTCPEGGTAAEELGILSPLPHEIQARTGRKLADLKGTLKTIDVQGADATNGQFLFPMGIGLGGIETPNFAEIDINKLGTPTSFDGIPWNLDRRLSPNGCVGGCESTPQPLDPFPFSGFDPRTQGGFVDVPYDAPHYTHSALSRVTNRVLSYVDHRYGKPNGDATVLAWPPVDPPAVGPAPPPPPVGTRGLITGLTPASGLELTTVVIDGVGLTGASAVSFAGRPAADFTAVDDFTLTAVVPAGAASGPVSVTTPSGVLTSAVRFTVVPAPTVTGFSPTTGLGGTSVVVNGTGFASATAVSIGGVSTAFTVLSATQLRATVPVDGISGPVLVDTLGGIATSAATFTVATPPPAPTVTGFSPSNGSPGTVVTIVGTDLQTTTGVYFGGAASISVTATATSVTAIVPAGAFDGPVSVIAAGGGATSAANFVVTTPVPPPPPPAVTALTPSHGAPGTTVLLSGTSFAFTTGVSFNGLPAAFQQTGGVLRAIVPDGATTGPVVVTTQSAGPGNGDVVFTVDPPAGPSGPTITTFTPSVGAVGTTVVLTGTGLTGVTGVSVNGTPATSFTALSPTSLQLVVGAGTTTGLVRVTAAAGIATSATPFTIGTAARPTVTSFTPTSGPVGTTITVTGNGFTGATAVLVGGIPVSSFTVLSATTLTAVVAPGTASGVVKVTGPGGSRLSAAKFTVLLPPVITGFSPQRGNSGTLVTLRGSHFTDVLSVSVNGVPARSFTVVAGNKLTFVVGTGTTTGPISVTTAGGTVASAVSFRITGTPR